MQSGWMLFFTLAVALSCTACAGSSSMYAAEKSAYYDAIEADMEPTGLEEPAFEAAFAPQKRSAFDDGDDAFAQGETASPRASADNSAPAHKDPEVPSKRLVIYNAHLGLYVFDLPETLKKAEEACLKVQCWIQQSTSNSLVMRVPAKRFEGLMDELDKFGDINYRNVTGQDVTEQFYDTQIRLKNALKLRDRYLELLQSARSVKDSLEIERELARITQEIEQIKGQLKFLSNRIAFSTITLQLEPKTQDVVHPVRNPLPFNWMRGYSLDQILN